MTLFVEAQKLRNPLRGSSTFESKIQAYFQKLIAKELLKIIKKVFLLLIYASSFKMYFRKLIIIALATVELSWPRRCRNVIGNFMVRLRPSELSGIKKIKYVFNLCYVGYVFPKGIFFILKFAKISQLFIKNSNFDLFFWPIRVCRNGTKQGFENRTRENIATCLLNN